MPSVEIIATPPGEAPESVRAAWVGLVLPTVVARPVPALTSGVVTGGRTVPRRLLNGLLGRWNRSEGYAVKSADAIAILRRAHPEAARWWDENAPHLARPGRTFLFATAVCREVPDAAPTPVQG